MLNRPRFAPMILAVPFILGSSGCATVQQMMAVRDVDFSFDRVAEVNLAGIDIEAVSSFSELGLSDASRLMTAVSERDLPLTLDVHLRALNPEDNAIDARLVRMDWTLLIEGRETLSGVFDDEVVLPPGEPRDVRVPVSLNLVEFFDGSARDLVELTRSLAGIGGRPAEVALRASPVVETAVGPIRYPRPLTLARGTVGGAR
ncbi:MAG: LEA type 2 family protein [Gemmatimonadota bacterium]|nr:LEA type 2 family protein [Gemmatimonadota bacterium]